MDAQGVAKTAADVTEPQRGLRAVVALRKLADSLEYLQVRAALERGMSWADIGDHLDVTRQAVHKKYARRIAGDNGNERNAR
ncbi:hypothetical protein [Clavibacter sp. CFBP 8614]|uniref:hypothetical protein n=1 Tax=unclassified Clavibacter TaxID=2626594 RepID=UPI004042476C